MIIVMNSVLLSWTPILVLAVK